MFLKRALAALALCACLCLIFYQPAPVEAVAPCIWETVSAAAFASERITDLAVSPNYAQDGTMFALTFASGGHNLWRTQDGALSWRKVAASGGCCWDYIELSPYYGISARVVYLLGSGTGGAMLWHSSDAGENWVSRTAPADTGSPSPFMAASDTCLYIAGFDGLNNRPFVCYSSDAGMNYTTGGALGNVPVHSLSISRDSAQNTVLLAGDTYGGVWMSGNNGAAFQPVAPGQLTGRISVAFDAHFMENYTVYAASSDSGGGIYRISVGSGLLWERVDAASSAGGLAGGVAVSASGVLYVASSRAVDYASSQGGLLRCLDPAGEPYAWQRVAGGLPDGTVLREGILECSGNRIWAVDSAGNYLLTFEDTLSEPVKLFYPLNEACGIGNASTASVSGVTLNWQPADGAEMYEWQLGRNKEFSVLPSGFSGNTADTTAPLPSLSCGETYYWRVRAVAPLYSPWSEIWSFTTSFSPVKPGVPGLVAPLSADTELLPLFRWDAASGAEAYEIVVSRNMDLSSPVISKTGAQAEADNFWQCGITLDYGTPYYWRVRAVGESGCGEWSEKGVFVTLAEPVAVPSATAPLPPAPPLMPSQGVTQQPPQTSQTVLTAAVPSAVIPPPVASRSKGYANDWVWHALAGGVSGAGLIMAAMLLANRRKNRLL